MLFKIINSNRSNSVPTSYLQIRGFVVHKDLDDDVMVTDLEYKNQDIANEVEKAVNPCGIAGCIHTDSHIIHGNRIYQPRTVNDYNDDNSNSITPREKEVIEINQ